MTDPMGEIEVDAIIFRAVIVSAIHTELMRQASEEDELYAADMGEGLIKVDGNINLDALAEAVRATIEMASNPAPPPPSP